MPSFKPLISPTHLHRLLEGLVVPDAPRKAAEAWGSRLAKLETELETAVEAAWGA